MSTLGTQRVATLSLYVPPAGAWRADVVLESGTIPTGTLTLTVSGAPYVGTVERADFDAAARPHAVIVGGLGWKGTVVSPISFQSDGGVRLSTVLAAVAKGAGQTIVQPTDVTIGDYYEIVASRPGEPVHWYDVLNDLVRGGYLATWRVDADGVTRFTPRTSTAVQPTQRATVLRKDAAVKSTTYGIDSPAQFLPGNTIDGAVIGAAHFRETHGKLEVEIRAPEASGGVASIKELVRRQVALAMQDIARTYVVASCAEDGRLDLSPPADAKHLPDLRSVEQWTMGAEKVIPPAGTLCLVVFRDERKTRPVVIGFQLSAGPFLPLARVGDPVQVFMPPSMPITGVITPPGSSFTGVLTVPAPALGTIQTGSTKLGGES